MRAEIEAAMLGILRDELFHPDRLRVEMEHIEAVLRAQEAEERGSELRQIEDKITAVRKLRLGGTAERAAIQELEAEREARALLAQLPALAKTLEKQLEATLSGGKATRDEMQLISDATRDLIKGGAIRLRPRGKTVQGRVELLGLGEKALRAAGATRRPRIGGSGGRI